jgi:hypothetical protein
MRIYLPYAQFPQDWYTILIRSRGDEHRIATEARAAIQSIDPLLAVDDVRPLDAIVGASVVWQGLRLTLGAALLGLVEALFCSGVMRELVFGIQTSDPLTLAVVAAILVAIGAAASWLPARRTPRGDPVIAMRAD